jgi:hypothetical protein
MKSSADYTDYADFGLGCRSTDEVRKAVSVKLDVFISPTESNLKS